MQAASFGSTNADPLDSVQRAWSAAHSGSTPSGDRVPLRADPGQSQSGNSSLSPQAYRVETTTAELAVSEILPITSVRAPRYYGGRSLMGAKVCFAKGGRTDRWPQMTAIQSRTILLLEKTLLHDTILILCIKTRTAGHPPRGEGPWTRSWSWRAVPEDFFPPPWERATQPCIAGWPWSSVPSRCLGGG
jgi:hypothetical protein